LFDFIHVYVVDLKIFRRNEK